MNETVGGYFYLAPWIVLIPVIGLLVNLAVGRRLGEKLSGAIASLASGIAFVIAVLLAVSLSGHPEAVTVPFLNWITVGDLVADWAFRVDTLSVTMMLVVSGVGTLIHIYAIGYMHEDVRHNGDPGRFTRFFVYLNLFIAAMMILVSADNYLMMFVGWEGVGLCSYLLIGFWFEKGKDGIGNAKAAKKAFVTNRIGDFGFLIAMFLMFWAFRSLQFDQVLSNPGQAAPGVLMAITLFMLLGVTGKSAQLPLFVWLPDAMAGPTPVSALIHAATMVTAGVYLVARSAPLYNAVPQAQAIVAWVGALTAIFAATIAVAQMDIKRVLAYSTISQLGFMVAAVGMGAYTAGMFHLITHAFFKALLFLSAGSVILGMEGGEHAVEGHHGETKGAGAKHNQQPHSETDSARQALDPQDMRNMGGLRTRMPVTFAVYLIGALALSGIAPLSGFFSKDEILAESSHLMPGITWVLLAAALLTAFYMGRQIFMVFFGQSRAPAAAAAKENGALITLPLIVLAILAFFGGVINLPAGFGGEALSHRLTLWLEHTIAGIEPGVFLGWLAGLALAVALLGLFLAYLVYGKRQPLGRDLIDPLSRGLGPVYTGMSKAWGVDALYSAVILEPYRRLSEFLARGVDLGFIDGIANGLGTGTRWISGGLRRIQTGYVRMYALSVIVGVIAIMAYLMLR